MRSLVVAGFGLESNEVPRNWLTSFVHDKFRFTQLRYETRWVSGFGPGGGGGERRRRRKKGEEREKERVEKGESCRWWWLRVAKNCVGCCARFFFQVGETNLMYTKRSNDFPLSCKWEHQFLNGDLAKKAFLRKRGRGSNSHLSPTDDQRIDRQTDRQTDRLGYRSRCPGQKWGNIWCKDLNTFFPMCYKWTEGRSDI